MKRSIFTLAATAALLAASATGAQAAIVCETITTPAVPAVYETVITPAVTVTEYEFTHAQDGNGNSQGQGPDNRWETDPNWNAETNPNSVGWLATGATRIRVLEVEKTTVTLVTPAVPETSTEQCANMPDGTPPTDWVVTPDAPAGNVDPAPIQEAATAPVVPVVAVPAPVIPTVPVAAVEAPEELAYTGATDWVFPAGLGLLGLGAAALITSRKFSTK